MNLSDGHLESFFAGLGERKSPFKIDGQTVGYMSKDLNDEMIENLKENELFSKHTQEKLIKEIKNKTLILAYTSRSMLGDIYDTFEKIFLNEGYIVGFFGGEHICIFIPAIRDLNGTIKKSNLFTIITHEYQHYFANFKSSYIKESIVKKTLKTWYNSFIKNYFQEPLTKKYYNELMNFWTKISDEYHDKVTIMKRYEHLYNIYDEMTNDESLNSKIKEDIKVLLEYVINAYEGSNPKNLKPYYSGVKAYKELGLDSSQSYIYQEFVFPSEVLAITFSHKRNLGNLFLNKYL